MINYLLCIDNPNIGYVAEPAKNIYTILSRVKMNIRCVDILRGCSPYPFIFKTIKSKPTDLGSWSDDGEYISGLFDSAHLEALFWMRNHPNVTIKYAYRPAVAGSIPSDLYTSTRYLKRAEVNTSDLYEDFYPMLNDHSEPYNDEMSEISSLTNPIRVTRYDYLFKLFYYHTLESILPFILQEYLKNNQSHTLYQRIIKNQKHIAKKHQEVSEHLATKKKFKLETKKKRIIKELYTGLLKDAEGELDDLGLSFVRQEIGDTQWQELVFLGVLQQIEQYAIIISRFIINPDGNSSEYYDGYYIINRNKTITNHFAKNAITCLSSYLKKHIEQMPYKPTFHPMGFIDLRLKLKSIPPFLLNAYGLIAKTLWKTLDLDRMNVSFGRQKKAKKVTNMILANCMRQLEWDDGNVFTLLDYFLNLGHRDQYDALSRDSQLYFIESCINLLKLHLRLLDNTYHCRWDMTFSNLYYGYDLLAFWCHHSGDDFDDYIWYEARSLLDKQALPIGFFKKIDIVPYTNHESLALTAIIANMFFDHRELDVLQLPCDTEAYDTSNFSLTKQQMSNCIKIIGTKRDVLEMFEFFRRLRFGSEGLFGPSVKFCKFANDLLKIYTFLLQEVSGIMQKLVQLSATYLFTYLCNYCNGYRHEKHDQVEQFKALKGSLSLFFNANQEATIVHHYKEFKGR